MFDVPIKEAIATSLVCVIAASTAAQLVFITKGFTNVLGMVLEWRPVWVRWPAA